MARHGQREPGGGKGGCVRGKSYGLFGQETQERWGSHQGNAEIASGVAVKKHEIKRKCFLMLPQNGTDEETLEIT